MPFYTWLREIPQGCDVSEAPAHLQRTMVLGMPLQQVFGSTVARPNGLYGRFGIWGKDAEDQSSNYRELRNLIETVEEEALNGYLTGGLLPGRLFIETTSRASFTA